MNNSLDRFSSPLETERVNPYHMEQMHEEQNYLNKKHMIDSFIGRFSSIHGYPPDAETVQETLYRVDLDLDLIEERLKVF